MVEKPKPNWLREVVTGGKSKDKPDSNPKAPSPEPFTPEAIGGKDDLIRPEELTFALSGGWKAVGESEEKKDASEISKETALVRLYLELSRNPPADFASRVRLERVQYAAKIVPPWTVDALHTYLSGEEVWRQPSFTKAVFEEINLRMLRANLSPRE